MASATTRRFLDAMRLLVGRETVRILLKENRIRCKPDTAFERAQVRTAMTTIVQYRRTPKRNRQFLWGVVRKMVREEAHKPTESRLRSGERSVIARH
jgi:hypothetical protein